MERRESGRQAWGNTHHFFNKLLFLVWRDLNARSTARHYFYFPLHHSAVSEDTEWEIRLHWERRVRQCDGEWDYIMFLHMSSLASCETEIRNIYNDPAWILLYTSVYNKCCEIRQRSGMTMVSYKNEWYTSLVLTDSINRVTSSFNYSLSMKKTFNLK